MESNHTKGQWKVSFEANNNFAVISNDVTVAISGESDCHQNEANAKLIASAPELLETLDKILLKLERISDAELTKTEKQIIIICQSAINKINK